MEPRPARRPQESQIMATDNSVGAVIVAAGGSSRMKGIDKTFAFLGGRPLITHTLDRFEEFPPVAEIALVLAADRISQGRELVGRYGYRKVSQVCAGGERRQDSVRAGLEALTPCRWVIIHDGARPGVDAALLQRGLDAARQSPDGAAIAAVPVKDTIKVVSPEREVTATLDRATLYAAQTPQIFRYDRLRLAHAQFAGDATDDAAIVESLGDRVTVFMGSWRNLKVTTPEDLAVMAEWVG